MPHNTKELERAILSCLLQEPTLMEKVKLEDKHFMNYAKFWKFMKAFYNQYKNLDPVLMVSLVDHKYKYGLYIQDLIEIEPNPFMFEKYQEQMLDLINEDKNERERIRKIYNLANQLIVRSMTTAEFYKRVGEIMSQPNDTL